jgi:ferredoxin
MGEQDLFFHYVSTHEEARKLLQGHSQFWVSNCGCREQKGQCSRSRMDLCLMFRGDLEASGSGLKEISRDGVEAIFQEAREKHLVVRPYRNEENPAETDGMCFCCDDCCGYFLDPSERSGKGAQIERTDMELCIHCGECVDVCYFGARRMADGELVVERASCYGCGLCVDVCPEECVEMVPRS